MAGAIGAGLVLREASRYSVPVAQRRPHAPNLAETIFRDLRRQILTGELQAGERLLGERELAIKYKTNRNTLREAVRKLEQSKLITVRHGHGVTVSSFRHTGNMDLLAPFLETAPDLGEVVRLLEDILPARLMMIEFAARLAVKRATLADIARLKDITELLITAFERADRVVIAHGFQQWVEALVDAGHSVAMRWVANPWLESYRHLLDRFPILWVLEPSFPEHLRGFLNALEAGDEPRALDALRRYYDRVDKAFIQTLATAMAMRPDAPKPTSGPNPAEPTDPTPLADVPPVADNQLTATPPIKERIH